MTNTLNFPIILGTSRPGRQSEKVANFINNVVAEIDGVKSFVIAPDDFDMPYDGKDEANKDPRYTEITEKADGFVMVVPEYNHSFSGSLKRMLDSEFANYKNKPVLLVGVSSGPWGGVRAIESILHVVKELGMIAVTGDLQFPNVQDQFDGNGEIKDSVRIKSVKSSIGELIWMANTLKWGRENLN